VQVKYDPAVVSYSTLLKVFWRNVDPLAVNRQFCDVGDQYRTAVFTLSASTFYPAEDYHQDYYRKNPIRYKFYRFNCGRDQRLDQLWGTNRH